MKIFKIVSACAIIFCTPSLANAQMQENCLSLEAVLKLSLDTDPAIGVALGEKEQSEARLKQVKADWLPQISGYSRAAEGDVGLVDGRTDNQIGLIVSQRLFDFGKGKMERHAAESNIESARFSLENAELSSAQTAAMRYVGVLEAQEQLLAAQDRENHLADIAKTVKRRLEVGSITRAEARSIEAEYATAQSARIEFGLGVKAAQSKLFITTGARALPCQNIDLVDATFRANMPATLEDALARADIHNPKLNAAEANHAMAQAQTKLAKRNQLPIISAQGVSAYIYDDFSKDWNRRERIGVEVTVPIWGGGRYSGQRSEALAKLRTSSMELNLLRRTAHEKVSLSWYRIDAYKALAKSRRMATQSYRAEASAIQKEFEAGLRTYQDVEKVDADLQDAVLSEIAAGYSFAMNPRHLPILRL